MLIHPICIDTHLFFEKWVDEIIFYTKDKIIYSPQRMFAPPFDKNLEITVKSKNKIKKIKEPPVIITCILNVLLYIQIYNL